MSPYVPKPPHGFLDNCVFFRIIGGRKVYKGKNQGRDKYFSYDELHGEIEVFNKRGKHIGVMDAVTGEWIKEAVPGRIIDVS